MIAPSKGCLLAGLAAVVHVLALAAPVAPPERPHIGYAYPAGGQTGTTFEVTLGGDNIYGATTGRVSGTGVTVQVIDSRDPQAGRETDGKRKNRRKNQAVIDEIVTLRVTVAPRATPGDRELVLVTPNGVTDPLVFQVGQLREVRETEPNERKGAANPLPELPATFNGQIMSGDVDTCSFTARKGQHLVIETAARALIPYLADAVPGWFQAVISLSDTNGHEVAYNDDYRFSPDPVLFYDVPADGTYVLAVRDAIYRGRADFVYRVSVGELPFITSVFPLGGPCGGPAVPVRLSGVNLPATETRIAADAPTPTVRPVTVTRNGLVSPPVPFALDDLPDTLEDDTLAGKPDGQKVTLPVIVNGRIRAPGQTDTYSFEGRQGQPVGLEVHARRLGSPLDSFLTLADAQGRVLGTNDDARDSREGLLTHQADSELTVTLPSNGTYRVAIRDVQGQGGDAYSYRLRIGPPVADLALRTTPASLAVARGGATAFSIRAIRRGGCTNDIRLDLDSASAPGCRLDGGIIPAGADTLPLTLTAADTAPAGLLAPRIRGTVLCGTTTISRVAAPAEDLMQAFIYRHLVTVPECVLSVSRTPPPFEVIPLLGPQGVLELPLGKETDFRVRVTRRPGYDAPIRLEFEDPPKGITLRKANIGPWRDTNFITVRTESKVEGRLSGNLILTAIMMRDREDNATGTNRTAAATHPAPASAPRPAPAAGTTNAAAAKPPYWQQKERVAVTLSALPFRVVPPPSNKVSDAIPDNTKR